MHLSGRESALGWLPSQLIRLRRRLLQQRPKPSKRQVPQLITVTADNLLLPHSGLTWQVLLLQAAEDKTFGLKNKAKSKAVQK